MIPARNLNLHRGMKNTGNGYHLTPVRMAIISPQITNAREGVEKREPSYIVAGNVNG